MVKIENAKGEFVELGEQEAKMIGLLSMDAYFEEEDEISSGEKDQKIVKIDFAEIQDLEFVKNGLQKMSLLPHLADELVDSGIKNLMKVLKIANYLQIDKMIKILKSAFFKKINKIAVSGTDLPDYHSSCQRLDTLKDYLECNRKNSKEELSEGQKKEVVFQMRYLKGQIFPKKMKFEDFYCRENPKSGHS